MSCPASLLSLSAVILFTVFATGCGTLRGNADNALARGDYRNAVDLYTQVLRKNPGDPEVKAKLTSAERGMLDESLDRFERDRNAGRLGEAMHAGLAAMQMKDDVHADAIDEARTKRLGEMIAWMRDTALKMLQHETSRGRALAARSWRSSWSALFARAEFAPLRAQADAEITAAGARTCAAATQSAGDQPFSLELVAAYCKEVGAPPAAEWRPHPLLVSGITITGDIAGTPVAEQEDLRHAISSALERSVWFSATASAHAFAELSGEVSTSFTRAPAELSRSWVERVPYQATETFTEEVRIPYLDTETYTERVPYTAYEDGQEPCKKPSVSLCTRSRPVTLFRNETRTRQVRRFRTEYVERTREVTRYRDMPRVFTHEAMKHEGRYQASYRVTVDMGGSVLPIIARESVEDSRIAYAHDVQFAPASVTPERGELPSALSWRKSQRERLAGELRRTLDEAWIGSFCASGVSSMEDAARCVRGRPRQVPEAVRARIAELVGDETDLVLALPRPREAVR
ncbi:MAG TPA: hypothetical protein VM580_16485 [Labilithrix sp.]|nr:hypothetical protein [Labilithrix sp.]